MGEDFAITERIGVAFVNLTARRGRLGALRVAVREAWRMELPATPHFTEGEGTRFIWAGPERWLVMSASLAPGALIALLRSRVDGLAAVCDQSDGRELLSISGRSACEVLAKGFPIDLHPSVFTPGSTAITVAAHIGCQIWQVDDTPAYEIAVPTSLAASFRRWLDGARPCYREA